MKVLITNPPGFRDEGKKEFFIKGGSRWSFKTAPGLEYCPYPFFIGYAASLLKSKTTHKIKAIDGVVEMLTPSQFLKKVVSEKPHLYITEIPTITFKEDMELVKKIKELSNAEIALAGHHVTVYAREILTDFNFVDYVLLGEYEFTLKELVEGRHPSSIPGLACRENSIVKVNDRRPLVDLDELPWPDREDLPALKYRDFCYKEPHAIMISSRGCPMNCIFCIERHIVYKSPVYRTRDPKDVVDEMEYLKKDFGVRQVYFDDQSLTVNRKHVEEICDEIIRRRLKITWTCMGDAFGTTYDTLKKMRRAGCAGMKLGLESAGPKVLKLIKKPIDVNRVKEIVAYLKRLNMLSHLTVIIGLPGQDEIDIRKTLKFVEEADPDGLQYSIATPFPGTPFYEQVKSAGYLISDDWSKYNGRGDVVISYPNFSADTIKGLYNELSKNGRGLGWGGRKRLKRKILNAIVHPLQGYRDIKRFVSILGLKQFFLSIVKILWKE